MTDSSNFPVIRRRFAHGRPSKRRTRRTIDCYFKSSLSSIPYPDTISFHQLAYLLFSRNIGTQRGVYDSQVRKNTSTSGKKLGHMPHPQCILATIVTLAHEIKSEEFGKQVQHQQQVQHSSMVASVSTFSIPSTSSTVSSYYSQHFRYVSSISTPSYTEPQHTLLGCITSRFGHFSLT